LSAESSGSAPHNASGADARGGGRRRAWPGSEGPGAEDRKWAEVEAEVEVEVLVLAPGRCSPS